MNHSGAMLSYLYFKKENEALIKEEERERIEKLFEYIEDNDLYTHKKEKIQEFVSGLASLNLDLNTGTNPKIFDVKIFFF
jgi:hypothetical protein